MTVKYDWAVSGTEEALSWEGKIPNGLPTAVHPKPHCTSGPSREGLFYFFKIIYLFERENKWERQRERESQADSMLRVDPDVRLYLMTPRSGTEQKPRLGHLTDCTTQAPQACFVCAYFIIIKI